MQPLTGKPRATALLGDTQTLARFIDLLEDPKALKARKDEITASIKELSEALLVLTQKEQEMLIFGQRLDAEKSSLVSERATFAKDVEATTANLAKQKENLDARAASIATDEQNIAARQQEIDQAGADLSDFERSLNARQQRVEGREAEVARREAILEPLKAVIDAAASAKAVEPAS